jgi:hypothetical protein
MSEKLSIGKPSEVMGGCCSSSPSAGDQPDIQDGSQHHENDSEDNDESPKVT